ncbi:MAG: peptidylprolyl isomerase, partial [Cyanobacteria bacterium]|nr:peptidylprolyl isomerase [Cyanobacteriota bacterium]
MRNKLEIQLQHGNQTINPTRGLFSSHRWMWTLLGCILALTTLVICPLGPTLAAPSVKGLIPRLKKEAKPDEPVVIFETDKGVFKLKVFKEDVPVTAEHFLSLVENGFYDGLSFHRYERDFCIQGG